MSPTIPVLTAVILDMQAALQAITSANGAYFYTVQASSVVTRLDGTLETLPETELPFLVLGHRIDAQGRDWKTTKPNAILDDWRVWIEGVVLAARLDAVDKLTAFEQIAADIERALYVDPFRGLNTDGSQRVQYTKVQQPVPYFGLANSTRVYFEQPVDFKLRRNFGSP